MRQLQILLLIVTIGFIGIALPFPIFSPLFLDAHSSSMIPSDWTFATRSMLLGVVLAVYPLGQFVGSPILGALSDTYGRRKIILLTLWITGLGFFLTGFAVGSNQLMLLIASRLVTGLMEGNIALARAYAADLQEISRHKSFGWISAGATLGYIIGPLLGGVLSNPRIFASFTFATPFYFAGFLSLLAGVVTYFYLPETNKVALLPPTPWKDYFKLLSRTKNILQLPTVGKLFLVGFFLHLGVDTYYEFFPVYLVMRWQANAAEVGMFTGLLAMTIGIGDGYLVSLLANYFKDLSLIRISLYIFAAGMILMLVVARSGLYLLFPMLGIAIAFATTLLSVMVSNATPLPQQGEVMGLFWGIRMLGTALICLVGGLLVAFSYHLPLLLASSMALLAIFILRKI